MERFVVGNIVLVQFPFSDLKGQKLRPALVLARVEFGNLILCQITSKPYSSKTAIKLSLSEFAKGNLPIVSYIRPDKLFTAETTIIERVAGRLKSKKTRHVLGLVREIFTPDSHKL